MTQQNNDSQGKTFSHEINLDAMRKKKVLICTPAYGGQLTVVYAMSLLETHERFRHYGLTSKQIFIENESLITRARNNCVAMFLSLEDYTHLFFIDADIRFKPEDALSLLHYCDETMPVVVGSYPKKGINWNNITAAAGYGQKGDALAEFADNPVVNMVPKPGVQEISIHKPLEVLEGGTGFMMIDRSVFPRIIDAHPEYAYFPDYMTGFKEFDSNPNRLVHAIFDTEVVNYEGSLDEKVRSQKRYLSEDYRFCRLCREQNIPIHLLPWLNLGHHGTYLYKGNIGAGLSLRARQQSEKAKLPLPKKV